MKRYIGAIMLIAIMMCMNLNVYANVEINEIDVSYSSNDFSINDLYDNYTTTNENEIKMITHFLETLKSNQGGGPPSDVRYLNVMLNYTDGSTEYYQVYPEIVQDIQADERLVYMISMKDYYKFCGFINSLILGKFDNNSDISINASKWAEKDIDKFIEYGFLPEWHQIGYNSNISRVEVCQLIDIFLMKEGIFEDDKDKIINNQSVFNDTNDISVNKLYESGIVSGRTETEFAPYDYIYREEAAKIISGLCGLIDVECFGLDINYADENDISDWAVDSVKGLSSIGVFVGDDNNKFNPQNYITKEEFVLVLFRLSEMINK